MLRRGLLPMVVCTALGCGAGGARAGAHTRAQTPVPAEAGVDRAAELAAQLPVGSDRCVVARPARVPAKHRGLLLRITQAEPLAWLDQIEIEAFASAQREHPDGPSSQVILLWTSVDHERLQAVLSEHGGMELHWDSGEAGCSSGDCPSRARFAGAHLLRIERGAFAAGAPPGVERHCLGLAERNPSALELSSARSRTFGSFGFTGMPLRASSELYATGDGVHVVRVHNMHSPIDAQRALEEELAPELLLSRAGSVGSNLRRRRIDADVRTDFDLLWEDLELARDDDARLRAAGRDAEALLRAPPPQDGTAPVRREDVLAELGYRLELLQDRSGDERRREADTARALLEHALERDPEDEGLALLLCELLLSEQREPEPARALVRRFAPRPGANRAWAALGRHAAALVSAEALADALLKDGLVDRRRARPVALEIVSSMREGASFDQAERAALDRPR